MTITIDPFKAEEDFRAALREAGLVPPDSIDGSGKLTRIDLESKKPGNKYGFYVYHSDGIPAGAFGLTNRPDELVHLVIDALERRIPATEPR